MKNLKTLTTLFTLLILMSCGGNSQMTGREAYKSQGEKIEDTKIIGHVRHAFHTNPMIPEKLVHIAVDRGIVQLSGFVRNNQEADLAILAARNVQGVKDVINSLVILSSHEYAARRANAEARDAGR